jgi:opine dehydrogenase
MVGSRLGPFLHNGHTVVLNPGYAGSLIIKRAMKEAGNNEQPLFAEFETLPYSSRIGAPGTVSIVSKNVRHPFAAFPGSRSHELVEHFQSVLGECVPRTHILEVALHNPNLVIHTTGVLLNVALVENRQKRFAMYRDGFPPSMWNVVSRLDKEKMDVLERLGAPRVSYFDEFKLRTFIDTTMDPLDAFAHYAAEAPDGPFTLDHRYVTEDVPIGLGLLHSLGKHLGIPTPVCDSLISIATALVPGRDFWLEARSLEELWDGSVDELIATLVGRN